MSPKKIIAIGLFCLMFLPQIIMAQNQPSIAVCDDDTQTFCLSSNYEYDLCAEIILDPNFNEPIDSFLIHWGDGSSTFVDGNTSFLQFDHLYDYGGIDPCLNPDLVTMILYTYLENGDVLNNAVILTFLSPPVPIFSYDPQQPCVGVPILFSATPCPANNFSVVSWNYGDGNTDNLGTNTYDQAGNYTVTLTVANGCDTVSGEQTIEILDPAIANAYVVDGVEPGGEPYIVCSSNVLLSGDSSINASTYSWSVLPAGNNTSWGNTMPDSIDPDINFLQEGPFTIVLEADNICMMPDYDTLLFEVVGTNALALQDEQDGCDSISYSPDPIVSGATYTVDGTVIDSSAFPIMLGPGDHTVIAFLSSLCGDDSLEDFFTITPLVQGQFLMNDTTLCSSTASFQIGVNLPGEGDCYLNGQLLPDCQFDPNTALENNVLIFQGDCLLPDTLIIDVVQTDALTLDIPQTQFCITDSPVAITPNPTGGQVFGQGIADPDVYTYDPQLAGVGLDTLEYHYNFTTPQQGICPAVATEFIEVFPELIVDFQVLDCDGNTLSFDTLNTSSAYSTIQYGFGDGGFSNETSPSHVYPAAGTYSVTVTLNQIGGCTFEQIQDVVVDPAPIAGFILNTNTNICSGDIITISNQASGDNLTYLWLLDGDTISLNANPPDLTLLAPGQDTSYFLTQIVRNGCSTDTTIEEIEVQAGPHPGFFISQNNICSGDTLFFNNVSANNGTYWFWDYGNGSTSTGPTPIPLNYITNVQDTFQIQLTVGNICDTTTYTQDVIVIPTDVTAFVNIDNPVACSGEPIQLINGSGVPNAEFYFSDGNTAFGDTVYHQFITDVDSTFQVTMRVYGCGFDEITIDVPILAPPILDLSHDEPVCINEIANFNISSNVANILLYYGDGDSTTLSISSKLYDLPGTYPLTAIATSVAGCTTATNSSIEILEVGSASFTVNDVPCENTLLNFIDNSMGNITDWDWNFGDGNQVSSTPPVSHEYLEENTYNASLITTFSNGCTDTSLQVIDVQAIPTVAFTSSLPDSCFLNYIFESTTSTVDSLIWEFGDGTISTLTNPEHLYTATASSPVTVVLTVANNGCVNTASQLIDIPLLPAFEVESDFLDDPCVPSTVSFTGNIINAESILWEFGDGTISTQVDPNHTYIDPGVYDIQLSVSGNGCHLDSIFSITIGEELTGVIDSVINVACFGESTGQAFANVLTGNEPYQYLWSNQQDNNPAIQLTAGSYEVTITDALGCTIELDQVISQPSSSIEVELINNTPASCYEASDAALEVAGLGGTFPYLYQWSNGDTTRQLMSVTAGSYTLTITDHAGCELIEVFLLEQPNPIQVIFDVIEPPCFGDTTGLIEVVEISGGTPAVNFPNYEVSLSPDFDTLSYIYYDLPQGLYTFYIRDEQGCTTTQTALMTEPSYWDLDIAIDGDSVVLLCDTILLEAQVTAPGASFKWEADYPLEEDSLSYLYVAPLTTGAVTVSATIGACTKTDEIFLTVDDSISVYIPNAFTPCETINCEDLNNYFTVFSDYPAVKQIRSMKIANRWGQTVFQKENFPLSQERLGWDGRLNGEPMPAGKYICYIVVETAIDDKPLEFIRPLFLIR